MLRNYIDSKNILYYKILIYVTIATLSNKIENHTTNTMHNGNPKGIILDCQKLFVQNLN